MKDIIEDNPEIDIDDLSAGMEFLIERELLTLTSDDEDVKLYGVTNDGIRALYTLSLVLASGVTIEEIEGREQPAEARQVSQCASALVKAMDELGA